MIVIAGKDDASGPFAASVGRHEGAVRLELSGNHELLLMPAQTVVRSDTAIGRVTFSLGQFDLQALTGGNRGTVWATPKPQQGREEIILELAGSVWVARVSLHTGPPVEGYPRQLVVDT